MHAAIAVLGWVSHGASDLIGRDGGASRNSGADRVGTFTDGGKRRATVIVKIFDLAIEALETLSHLDLAAARDRLDRTGHLAEMARAPAFGAPLQHIDEMQSVGERQHAAQRTQKAAVGTLGEEADHQQYAGIKD